MSRSPRTRRLAAVVLGALAAVVVLTVARVVHGDLLVPAGGDPAPVAYPVAAAAAVLGGLAGWAVLAATERWAPTLAARWYAVATVGTLLSLAGPFGMSGIATADRFWLAAMHLAVAAVVVPVLASTRTVRADATTTDAPLARAGA